VISVVVAIYYDISYIGETYLDQRVQRKYMISPRDILCDPPLAQPNHDLG